MENNYTLFEVQKQIDVKGAVSIIDAWRGENFSFDGESHDFWEMVCVADGNAGITADDSCILSRQGTRYFISLWNSTRYVLSADKSCISTFCPLRHTVRA